MGVPSWSCDTGISAVSNQLVAGLIIVMHMKSIIVLSLPLRVDGPMRSTYKASQGWWYQVLLAAFHICDTFVYSPDNCDIFWHEFGLSFWDLSNTSKDGLLPQERCSQDVEGSGDTWWYHTYGIYLVLTYNYTTTWCFPQNHKNLQPTDIHSHKIR